MSDPNVETVAVRFSSEEKRRLEQLAGQFGHTLAEYIRDRVLAESSCEEQVLRFLADELTAKMKKTEQAFEQMQSARPPQKPSETPEEQKARIVKEVRDSLTEEELDALAHFFKPTFDAGIWPSGAKEEP